MNKSIQTVLLGVVFAVCGAAGYFIGESVFSDTVASGKADVNNDSAVVETPVVSTVPSVLEVSDPVKGADGKYSFTAAASVESEDVLLFCLYSDEACSESVANELEGVFSGISPVPSQTYYLRVQNYKTKEYSETVPVKGFAQPVMYEKITKAELENLFNVAKNYDAAPKNFGHRISKSLVITVNGAKDGERGVSTPADICTKTQNGIWSSATVENLGYDGQGRLNKLVIRVNY
ncbi:MAG: hypothetical protein E7118_07585 [Bacteroidales bacterium]|nr:hypothetical protein [Bacteroidales bacterium]